MKNKFHSFYILAIILISFPSLADEFVDSEFQNLKYKEASFYPQRADQRGIEIGILRFEKNEQIRIFGKKISDYQTYDVAITNNSKFRIHLNSIEVFNTEEEEIIGHNDVDRVMDKMDVVGNGNKDNLRSSIVRTNLLNKTLQHKIIEPGDTLQGVLFIRNKDMDNQAILKVKIQNLTRLAYLDIEVPFEE